MKLTLTLLSAAIVLAFVAVEAGGLYPDGCHLTVGILMAAYLAAYYSLRHRIDLTATEARMYSRVALFCWLLLAVCLLSLFI